MLGKLLLRDEGRVLTEQLRLVLRNVGMSVIPTIVLLSLLVWMLGDEGKRGYLLIWAAVVLTSKLLNYYHARRTLAAGGAAFERPERLVWTLMTLNAIDGIAWGTLPWVTLTGASTAEIVLVVAVMAGVTSNAMSVLSPVLPVFVSFCLCAVTATAVKFWLLNDPIYQALAGISALYVLTHIAQGRIGAIAARSAIKLRFENSELIERLREETDKAQAAHREAEQANLAKSKFLAAASHDLRQPIHAQGLFLELIGREELSPTQRSMLENAAATNRASSEMLNTLLDFSRIEAGVVEPQWQAMRLQDVMNKVDSELAPQAVAKGLVYRSRDTEAVVWSDPVLLELILRNLVSNAARYTDQGGLLVASRARGEQVLLEVWDSGIGIEPAQQQEIFQEFHQLGNPERDRNKGLGLGLAIVDGLARVLGHRLTLASRPQRGSVFRLALPLSQVPLTAAAPQFCGEGLALVGKRVLVLDDDAAVRVGMAQLLQSWGCSCVAVDSIEEAIDAVRQTRPDLLISDYRLRGHRNGSEAIALLRAELGVDLPALLITGDTAPERLREAQSSGVPLLHKPTSAALLHRKLVELTHHKRH
jgi:two-component system, sensor histidine kinase